MMWRLIIICMAGLVLSACATVNKSPSDHFRIDSVPQGAKVITSLETRESKKKRSKDANAKPVYFGCEPTPCSIKLSRHSNFIATVKHEGYEPAELYIDSTTSQGSFAGSSAATTATVTGTAVLGAATVATLQAFGVAFAQGLTSVLVNVATYGLVNIPPSSIAVAGTTSTSSAAAAAVPPALAVSGGMLLVDMASGANKKLFPNPVVLGLAEEGQQVLTDPLVTFYRKELDAKEAMRLTCDFGESSKEKREACNAAKATHAEAKQTFRDFKKALYKAIKEDAKAAREQAKLDKAKLN